MKGTANLYGKNVGGDIVVTIDREFPSLFENSVSDREWIDFCNEVDAILEQLTELNRKSQQISEKMKPFLWINFMIMFSGFIAAMLEEGIASILFIVSMFTFFALLYKRRQLFDEENLFAIGQNVFGDLKSCCTEASSQHSNVSFRMKPHQDLSVAEALQAAATYSCGGQTRYQYYVEVAVQETGATDLEMSSVKK